MSKTSSSKQSKGGALSAVSVAFLENNTFLKKFLTRFFSDQQDIEDVAQEAYLRAYVAEQNKNIEQPKAYLFRVAKNIALTKLTKKSRQITDYIADLGASVVIQSEAAAEDEVEAEQTLGLYCEAVAALPEKCRQVFLRQSFTVGSYRPGTARSHHITMMQNSLAKVRPPSIRRKATNCPCWPSPGGAFIPLSPTAIYPYPC